MTSEDTRRSFLKFFERHGHRVVPSSALVPADDPTLLFTNAGMNQFKDVFLGRERRDYRRAASSQKCMRVSGKHNDLDNVGPSLRHHTFFEMLGNFSFGDYFKQDAIPFAWQLLTELWQLAPDRLYATVFKGEAGIPRDEEAHAVWRQLLPSKRVAELGLDENFWAMGETGPCGRCSEVHYFRGDHIPCPEPRCLGVECRCDRFVEIWNNVFMEFDRQPDGTLKPLAAPSIDTGMGLERIVAVLQNKISNYDTDLFEPLLQKITQLTSVGYGPHTGAVLAEGDVSMRLIADHMRAMTFLIADGVLPSNEWRGYVLRKIMRRAMRHGKKLGLTEPFLYKLVDVLVNQMGDAYPELRTGRASIVQIVQSEEERFDAVLNRGLPKLEEAITLAVRGAGVIPGDRVFHFSDTYGLPLDFVEELATERGVRVDRPGFEHAMEAQRRKSRAGQTFEVKKGLEFEYSSEEARRTLHQTDDRFEGYTTTRVAGVPILGLFDEQQRQALELRVGESGYMVIERTPFYEEAGGQVSDRGRLYSETGSGEAIVDAMTRLTPGAPRVHRVRLTSGRLDMRDLVTAEVDVPLRDATRRNHTATHLLHAALRQVLGPHVKQAGSLVAPDRVRFDLSHFAPVTRDELNEIERVVNEHIYANALVHTEIHSTRDAMAAGAMALFGEKYGNRVRVVSVPGFSMELCSGTHCRATGDIGAFVIVQESGIAAGVRRIEALSGAGAVHHLQHRRATLDRVLHALNAPEDQAFDAVRRLQADTKRLAREVSDLKLKAALGAVSLSLPTIPSGSRNTLPSGPHKDEAIEVAGVRMVARRVSGLDKAALRALADTLRDRVSSGVVVLASENEGRVALVVSVTKDLAGRLHAGKIVKEIAPIVGGTGGGRADFAEAGGKQPEKIDGLLASSQKVVSRMLSRAEPVT